MVKAQGIKKSYSSLEVIKGVDFYAERGTISTIVGPSGAGKSTLLQVLGTLDTPDAGTLEIDRKSLLNLSLKQLASFRNHSIGFIFQFHNLLPEFSAKENVALPALIANMDMKKAYKKAEMLLDQVGLSQRSEHKPFEMSGGEQQRVAIARALINEPAVIMADEPSGNLDTDNASKIHELIYQLCLSEKQTFIIVTHNPQLAGLGHHKYQMVDGLIHER